MKLKDIVNLIGPDDIQASLDPQLYLSLTSENSDVVVRAITSAGIWLYGILKRCNVVEVIEEEVLKEALIKRSIYELFSRAETELSAEDKKQEAEALLFSLFGDCVSQKSKLTSGAISYDPKLYNTTS